MQSITITVRVMFADGVIIPSKEKIVDALDRAICIGMCAKSAETMSELFYVIVEG